MMKYLLGIAGVGAIVVITFGLSSCGNQSSYIDQWYGSQNFDELIQDYHNALHPISKPEPNSRRSLYLDFRYSSQQFNPKFYQSFPSNLIMKL